MSALVVAVVVVGALLLILSALWSWALARIAANSDARRRDLDRH